MESLERVVVSRKTPNDGRLLITAASATRLAAVGTALALERDGRLAPARLHTMSCTCGKGTPGGEPHLHHFLESSLLETLSPETEVTLVLDAVEATVRVDLVSTD